MPPQQVDTLVSDFRGWLGQPEIARVLSRDHYPVHSTLEREVPFLHRSEGALIEGVIDRLVLVRNGGELAHAEVLDFKTDAVEREDRARLQSLTRHYTPQLAAYRDGIAHGWQLAPGAVHCRLVFLCAGTLTSPPES